jgi:hypothetical protein
MGWAALDGFLGGADGITARVAAIPAATYDDHLAGGADVIARVLSDDAPWILIIPGAGAYELAGHELDPRGVLDADTDRPPELHAIVAGPCSPPGELEFIDAILGRVSGPDLHLGDHGIG